MIVSLSDPPLYPPPTPPSTYRSLPATTTQTYRYTSASTMKTESSTHSWDKHAHFHHPHEKVVVEYYPVGLFACFENDTFKIEKFIISQSNKFSCFEKGIMIFFELKKKKEIHKEESEKFYGYYQGGWSCVSDIQTFSSKCPRVKR